MQDSSPKQLVDDFVVVAAAATTSSRGGVAVTRRELILVVLGQAYSNHAWPEDKYMTCSFHVERASNGS